MPPKLPLKKLLHPSIIFVLGQTFVGGLNYLYQVYVTQVVSQVQFGQWSVWFAQFSVSLLLALWVQTLCTLDGPGQKHFSFLASPRVKWLLIGGLSLLSMISVMVPFPDSPLLLFNICGWLWAVLQALYFGRALARQQLRLVSVAMVAGALLKFSFPLIMADEFSCYLGVLFGPLATVYILAFFESSKIPTAVKTEDSRFEPVVIFCALLLAAATSWVPQMDLLLANRLLDEVAMGQFAKVALVYKALFFFILILAQLLLSKQVQSGVQKIRLRKFLVVPAFGVLMAVPAFIFFPVQIAPAEWVGLGILHISTLTFLFLVLQAFASQRRWVPGFLILGLFALESLLVFIGGVTVFHSLWSYFVTVIILEALLGAAFLIYKRSEP